MTKVFSVTTGLLLAACAAPAPPAPVADTAPPPVVAEPEPVQTVQTVQTPEPAAPAEPEPVAVDMTQLEDQTPTDVIAYLGTPSLVRRDGSVQVMIFENSVCVVEIIFYEPANGDHFRARRINTRSRSGHNVDTENCVRQHLELQQ